MTRLELTAELGKVAERTKRNLGLDIVVVIGFDSKQDMTPVGAHVPDVEVLQLLLQRVLRSIDASEAKIIDKRRGAR